MILSPGSEETTERKKDSQLSWTFLMVLNVVRRDLKCAHTRHETRLSTTTRTVPTDRPDHQGNKDFDTACQSLPCAPCHFIRSYASPHTTLNTYVHQYFISPLLINYL